MQTIFAKLPNLNDHQIFQLYGICIKTIETEKHCDATIMMYMQSVINGNDNPSSIDEDVLATISQGKSIQTSTETYIQQSPVLQEKLRKLNVLSQQE